MQDKLQPMISVKNLVKLTNKKLLDDALRNTFRLQRLQYTNFILTIDSGLDKEEKEK